MQNQFSIKDSFDAASRINSMLPEVKNSNDLVFVSLDVVSLFTNVPSKKTVDIILKRVDNNKEISTTLSKPSLKKLILDTCQKNPFSFNNKMYQQIDGVNMGGSLSPVLANIIKTEFEEVVAENLIKTGIVTFCARYVDDTLLVVKRKNIDFILQKLSSFDKSLKFTINTFEHCVPNFLDIEICLNGRLSQIRDNTIVLDRCNNWNELLFKEALMIKRHCPTLNTGLRASNKLQLF